MTFAMAAPATPRVFLLRETAAQGHSEADIAMLYELFLGRSAESAFVLSNHCQQPFATALRVFLDSREFFDAVVGPLGRGEALSYGERGSTPRPGQVAWLLERTLLDEPTRTALRQAATWEAFFTVLLGLDGFLGELPEGWDPAVSADAAPGHVPAVAPSVPAAAGIAPADGLAGLHHKLLAMERLLDEIQAAIDDAAT